MWEDEDGEAYGIKSHPRNYDDVVADVGIGVETEGLHGSGVDLRFSAAKIQKKTEEQVCLPRIFMMEDLPC